MTINGLDLTIIGPGTEVHVASYGVLNSWRRTWTNAQDQEICCREEVRTTVFLEMSCYKTISMTTLTRYAKEIEQMYVLDDRHSLWDD